MDLLIFALSLFAPLLFALLLAVLILWILTPFRHGDPLLDSLSYRLPTIVGIISVLCGFWFLPWLSFTPWQYLTFVPDWAKDLLPEALDFVTTVFGSGKLGEILGILNKFSSLPGRWLIILMPTLDVWNLVLPRLAIGLPVLVGVCALLWLVLSYVMRSRLLTQAMGTGQAIAAFVSFVLLLWQVPNIDAWGTSGNLQAGIFPLLTGARIAYGAWIVLIGLFYLVLGGLREIERGRDMASQHPASEPALEGLDWSRKALPLAGVVIVLISFLVLPWLRFGNWSENLRWIDEGTGLQEVVDVVPDLLTWAGCESVSSVSSCLVEDFDRAGLSWLQKRAEQGAYLTGLSLILSPPPSSLWLRVSLFLVVGAGILALVWSLNSLGGLVPRIHTVLVIVGVVSALIALLVLAGQLPVVDNLGVRSDFQLNLLLLLSGARAGAGVWGAMLGQALIGLGALAEAGMGWEAG